MERRERVISNNVMATCNSRWKHNFANILYALTAYAIMCKWKLQVTTWYCLVHGIIVSNFDQVTQGHFIIFSDTSLSQSPCWSTQLVLWWLRKMCYSHRCVQTQAATLAGFAFMTLQVFQTFIEMASFWQTFKTNDKTNFRNGCLHSRTAT